MERRRSAYHLFKRTIGKRKLYYCRFIDTKTGKTTKTLSTGETNKTRAVQWAERRLQREIKSREHITIRELSEGFWYTDGAYARSRRARGYSISHGHLSISKGYTENHIVPVWGTWRVADLTPGKIDTWILDLHRKGTLAPATINKVLATLRALLDQAVARGYLTENPASFVKPVRTEYKRRGVLTDAEVSRLLAGPDLFCDYRHYTINLLAFATGARIGELRALFVENVKPDRVEILQSWEEGHGFKPPKYNSVRAVPISENVYNAVQYVIRETDPERIIFYSTAGKDRPMSKSVIEKQLRNALVNLSLPRRDRDKKEKREEALAMWRERGVCVHSWRHKLNSVLRARGVPDSKIRLLTGHRGEAMTDWYTRYEAEDFRDVVGAQTGLIEAKGAAS